MAKVAGRIEREELAEIFARAERIRSERGGGRLGRVMLDELMARAKDLAKGPRTGRMKRLRLDQTAIVDPAELERGADLERSEEVVQGFSAEEIVEGFSEPAPRSEASKARIDLAASGDELGVLPEGPITRDDPRAQPRPAPSLRQLSTLLDERAASDADAGGLDSILAQATELTFEGYEDELASLLEETYERYQRGTFELFTKPPAPEAPPEPLPAQAAPGVKPPKRDTPLANWRPPTLDPADLSASRRAKRPPATPSSDRRGSGARAQPSGRAPSSAPQDPPRRATARLDGPPRPQPPQAPRRRPTQPLSGANPSASGRGRAPTRPYGPNAGARGSVPPRVHRGPIPSQAEETLHDPFAGDPFELLPQRADPATETRQAFALQLERHGAPGMLERKNPPRGQPGSLPIRIVFHPGRGVFGALLEPRLEPGDRFQLRDGQVFGVVASEFVFVADTPCYQEIRAEPLGSLRAPLHASWE